MQSLSRDDANQSILTPPELRLLKDDPSVCRKYSPAINIHQIRSHETKIISNKLKAWNTTIYLNATRYEGRYKIIKTNLHRKRQARALWHCRRLQTSSHRNHRRRLYNCLGSKNYQIGLIEEKMKGGNGSCPYAGSCD